MLFFFISAIEFCGEKHRTYPLFCLMASYGLSSIFTPVLAMYLSSWQSLLMVATIPNIIVIIAGLFSYIPESIRWQVCKGKPYRVLETVQKMAKVNSVEFSVSTYLPTKLLNKIHCLAKKLNFLAFSLINWSFSNASIQP